MSFWVVFPTHTIYNQATVHTADWSRKFFASSKTPADSYIGQECLNRQIRLRFNKIHICYKPLCHSFRLLLCQNSSWRLTEWTLTFQPRFCCCAFFARWRWKWLRFNDRSLEMIVVWRWISKCMYMEANLILIKS